MINGTISIEGKKSATFMVKSIRVDGGTGISECEFEVDGPGVGGTFRGRVLHNGNRGILKLLEAVFREADCERRFQEGDSSP